MRSGLLSVNPDLSLSRQSIGLERVTVFFSFVSGCEAFFLFQEDKKGNVVRPLPCHQGDKGDPTSVPDALETPEAV